MTREDIILALIAEAGASHRSDLVLETGWSIPETRAVVDQLMEQGKVVPFPAYGNNQAHRSCKMVCLPATRAAALEKMAAQRRRER